MAEPQRFTLDLGGRRHEVEIAPHAIRRTVTWAVDGDVVATRTTADDSFDVRAEDEALGRVELRFSALGRPKRATWYAAGDSPFASGVDLDPEPGSPAAAYAERLAAHPTRFTLVQTGLGVLKVVLPILLASLALKLAVSLPWPHLDLPSIPWPDLPSIDLPSIDLPAIPWPDWHLPSIAWPGWVRWAADHVKYVWPIVLAFVLAPAEIRRRRQQEERKVGRDNV